MTSRLSVHPAWIEDALQAPSPPTAETGLQVPNWALSEITVPRGGRYAIKGLAPRPSLVMVYGQSGSAKTHFVIRASFAMALQQPFFGRRVGGGAVAFVAAEARSSTSLRFAAIRDEQGVGDIPLHLVGGQISLIDPEPLAALVRELRIIRAMHADLQAVIVDTLAAAAPGMDENSPEMGLFVNACCAIRDEFACAVWIVHHSGKDASKGARGHSSLRAAVDTEIEVTATADGTRTAKVTKSRDGVVGEEMAFRLRVIDLGVDDDGDPITAAVAEEIEADEQPPAHQAAPRLTPEARLALDALREVLQRAEDRTTPTSVSPGGRPCCSLDAWLARYRARRGRLTEADDAERRKEMDASLKAFNRARDALAVNRVVGIFERKVWLW